VHAPGRGGAQGAMAASPSTTRARRADARLLHHVLDAPPRFGACYGWLALAGRGGRSDLRQPPGGVSLRPGAGRGGRRPGSPWAADPARLVPDAATAARRTSRGVRSPRAASMLLAPPATATRTTSLTVPPCACATAQARSRFAGTRSRRWCPLTGTFSEVPGAAPAAGSPARSRDEIAQMADWAPVTCEPARIFTHRCWWCTK
jgi:hypothetical protein